MASTIGRRRAEPESVAVPTSAAAPTTEAAVSARSREPAAPGSCRPRRRSGRRGRAAGRRPVCRRPHGDGQRTAGTCGGSGRGAGGFGGAAPGGGRSRVRLGQTRPGAARQCGDHSDHRDRDHHEGGGIPDCAPSASRLGQAVQGFSSRASQLESASGEQRPAPLEVLGAGQVGQGAEHRAHPELGQRAVARGMVGGESGVVPGGEGRRPAYARAAAPPGVATSSRSRPMTGRSSTVTSTSAGSRPTSAQCRRSTSILPGSVVRSDGQVAAVGLLGDDPQRPPLPEPPTRIGNGRPRPRIAGGLRQVTYGR